MKSLTKTKRIVLLAGAFLLLVPSLLVLVPGRGDAAALTTSYVRLNRLKSGQGTSFRVQFKAASSQTANLTIDFNGTDTGTAQWTDGANSGVVNSTQSVTTAACASETGDTALPGSITAAGSGSTVTISSVGATTSGVTYCADLTSSTAVTNPTTTGEYHPTIAIGSDSVTVALRIINEDSIVVTATVPPSFNFQFNNTSSDAFGNLDPASVKSTTGKQITLTTNANSGWIVWVKDTNSGLKSVTAGNHVIASTTAGTTCASGHGLSAGTEGYGLVASINTDASGGGTVALDNNYNCSGSTAGGLDTTFRPVASANGTANGDIIAVLEKAAISGSSPAANDYTDTLTFVGAGNF